jgi:hypothetical protein
MGKQKRKPDGNINCAWNCGNWATWMDPICSECRQRELELAEKAKEALPVKNNVDSQPMKPARLRATK